MQFAIASLIDLAPALPKLFPLFGKEGKKMEELFGCYIHKLSIHRIYW
jgi:hypothetical protein